MKKIISIVVGMLLLGTMTLSAQLNYGVTLTQAMFNNNSIVVAKTSASWDNGINMSKGGFNWDEYSAVIALSNEGVPDSLFFACKQSSAISTGTGFVVYQSATNGNWSTVSTPGRSGTTLKSYKVKLNPTTRYLKFAWSGNFDGTYSNIKVSELKELALSASNVEFGTVHVDDEVAPRTLTATWTNIVASVTSNNEVFSPSPTAFGVKGQYQQSQVVSISLQTQTAGDFNGTLTVSGGGLTRTATVHAKVDKFDQTISWTQSENIETDAIIALPTSTSGLTDFTFDITDPSVLTFENGAFVIHKAGVVTVTPHQAGNYKYNAATGNAKTLTINKVDPSIITPPQASIIVNPQPISESILSGGAASVAGTFAWVALPSTIKDAGTYNTEPVIFTPDDQDNYNTVTLSTKLVVLAQPTITVTASDITYPATTHTSRLTVSGTPGTAIWNEPDNTLMPGTHADLSVHFIPSDATAYAEADVTTTLTVLPPTTYGEATGGCCPGSSYYYHGQFYAVGTHTVTLRNYLGGDSIVTLHVTEYPTYDETYDVTIYSDQTFLWNCDTYTQAGTYTHTYMTRRGCDSTVTINLTVLPQKTYGEVLGDICTGELFPFGDHYYPAGTYTETLVNHLGGDSIVTITVTEHPTFEASFYDTICSGDSLLWDGIYYKEAGSFTRHYRTIYGCDSAVTLNLALRPSYSIPESMTIASGWQESWRGKDLSGYASGVYEVYDSLTTVLDCDSVFVLNLTVIAYGPTTYGFDSAYVCPGDNYTYLDSLMTDSGTYVFRLRNSLYGDSIITFNLRYWPTYKKKSNRVIHQGINYKWRGQQLSGYDEGSYVLWDSLQSVHGCDSLFYCTLTILPPETQYNEVYATICPGDTFYYENRQFTDSGTYELPVPEQSRFRGDSVNRIHLAWYPHYVLDNRRIMYEGQPERWRGRDLSGFPVCDTLLYDSLLTAMGCDSVFRLQLTVQMVPTTFFYDTMLICDSEPFRYCHDTLINSAGDYVFHLVNALGGDSVVSLHVEDHPSYFIAQYDTILQGEEYHWRNRTYVLRPYDHVFMDSLRSIYGCDSVYCLYLHVNAREYLLVEEMSVCQNSVQTWHGKSLRTDSAGYFPAVQRDAYYTGFDADSVYVLNLTVNASPVIDYYLTWKQGHQKTWYLEHFSTLSPGYYTFTSGRFLHTRQGCDSLEVMHLQVLPTTYGAIEVNLCPDSVYNYNGKTYSQAGVYTVIIDNHYCGTDSLGFDSGVHGDSIITLTVHQRKKYDLHPELHAAYGDTLFWRGVPHRLEVGTFVFRDTTQSVYGCDSLTTLTVFVDRAQQRIAWNPDTLSVHVADSILLRAKASSGLPVTFVPSSLFYAYVTEQNWLVGRNLGQVTITAVQNGDLNYYAASPVEYVFEVLEPLPLDGLETVRPDDLDALPEGTEPEKFIHNGHLYIRTSDGLFDAAGRKITASPSRKQ